ncbi:MAG: class I SAM-dependent methyltransferase [Bacteroidia bacterium]|nr:class I SAM-dependent methyltransferase [Bacteroidia bacterium]NND26238.1 class I SAM-dependent methyltransferase [Flavobacteriaceae bacterium]MBT8279116.1 class I SAM-dependent methyltransferase [Bacteroidia bacterium]NNK61058.1 class I SAM-dependent methyltransferase [Flavobacteriaceae bacterium]NNL33291.1 class I SAM-dependent methyltransferase [Flavobacteriaceae bacterium]
MSTNTKDWFTSWFNTPYYHLLYKERDDDEAHAFMQTLTHYLNISEDAHILDLACGRGRHAVYLNSIGYKVTGLDLSEENIAFAKQFENERLKFDVHDMSKAYDRKFDAIFNLFTSFGYFENEADNLNTIKAIKSDLTENGIAVIDFMNVNYVIDNLVTEDVKEIEGITFKMTRHVEDGYIVKNIYFEAEEDAHHYQERVKAFTLKDFQDMFEKANLQLIDVFGDYKLNPYHKQLSERLILIFM